MHEHPDEHKKRDSQETLGDEAIRHDSARGNVAWGWNGKRTYDTYQDLDLDRARKIDEHYHTLMANSQSAYNRIVNNAITADHAYNMQAIRHQGVESDALWSDVEAAAGDAMTIKASQMQDVARKAADAAVAAIVANMATGRPPVNTGGT